jgi:HK97 family phage major capsid protein
MLGVADLFPLVRTSQAAYVYMSETTFTNNAAEASEGGTYAESALALTQVTVPVQKVATFIPVTDEQLEDVDGIQSYLDQRLGYMIRARVDSQLLVGDGTPPNIRGVNNAASIQTQALGGDVTPDAIYKAMTAVRVTGRANPSGIVMHPNDWQDIKLLRSSDGIYIWGNPADNAPDRIWGVNVVITDAQTQNTAIVGDFAGYSLLVLRRDLEIQISNSHSTYFIEGKQAVRADLRLAAVYLRGTAFCKVTGI